MMPSLPHHRCGPAENARHLLAQQHEDGPVGRKLDGVPDGSPLHAGLAPHMAPQLGVADRDPSRDSRQNARAVQVLGEQIGAERDQKADQDECARVLPEVLRQP